MLRVYAARLRFKYQVDSLLSLAGLSDRYDLVISIPSQNTRNNKIEIGPI